MSAARVDRLSDGERARLDEWADRWIEVGLRTAPADRGRFEAAVRDCYRFAGIPFPGVVVWVSSPLVLAFAAPAAALSIETVERSPRRRRLGLRGSVHPALEGVHPALHAVSDAEDSTVCRAVDAAVCRAVAEARWTAVGGPVGYAVDEAVDDPLDAVDEAVDEAVGRPVRDAVLDTVGFPYAEFNLEAVHGAVNDAVRDAVRDAVGGAVAEAVSGALDEDALDDALYEAVHHVLGVAVHLALDDCVDDEALDEEVDEEVARALLLAISGSFHTYPRGQFSVGSLADDSFFREVCRLELPSDIWDRARAYERTAEAAGWWWPQRRFVMVCERPLAIHRELVDPDPAWPGRSAPRLHCDDGPAVVWPDGWGVWSVHGVRVPQRVVEAPESLTAAEITGEINLEVRRVMLERYGAERYLREVEARLVAQDDHGKLWRVEFEDGEPLQMVEVVNATHERDETSHVYFLRVPPQCATAHEAVAWTFSLGRGGYEPEVQT